MYISTLIVETGDNPDRPRPGRDWLRNLYHVHQRLAMGFPSDERRKNDAAFLKPYNGDDFPPIADCLDVHNGRSDERGFLFRVDAQPSGGAVVLVQSAKKPEWDYAFGNSPLLRCHEVNQLKLDFAAGTQLHFRVRANVTRRMANGPLKGKLVGVGTNRALALEWLWRKAADSGFELLFEPAKKAAESNEVEGWDKNWLLKSGWASAGRRDDETAMRFQWTQFDGLLRVTDPGKFRETIIRGVGRAKAFGFGLLSVLQRQ